MARSLLLASLALGSAAVSAADITEIDGLVLTNGLASISDPSALPSVNQGLAISTLTDGDLATGIINIGVPFGSSLEGTFSGPISSNATAIYFVQPFVGGLNPSGPLTLQLILSGDILTNGLVYILDDYTVTAQAFPVSRAYFIENNGAIVDTEEKLANKGLTSNSQYGYLEVPFSDFGVDYSQVIGIRLANIGNNFPDFTYIGAGYAGAPIPEPSTYGLALGGLVLAAVALRRRRKA